MTDADKRDKIIAAAYTVLSEKGYDKASTKEIASTAGVAQGLINYYFSSKDLLFAEVFRRQTERFCASFDHLIPNTATSLTREAIGELLEASKKKVIEDVDWFRLRYELFAIGLRNEAARETLKVMLATERKHISDKIAKLSGLPPEQATLFASIFYSVFQGLGLQEITDPDFKYDETYEMVGDMYNAFYEQLTEKREP
ncbi:TetR/AcrR family transcriptional regulator [Cohnella soli]|uniref:TetR/AcrR family transcriptional regulator n=1 Tax=Cohnella soli TaxID=425005 RepID=A0ABW0I5Q1_9BACL